MAPEQRLRRAQLWRARLSLRGSCRAVGVRLTWRWPWLVACLPACPEACQGQRPARPPAVGRASVAAEADERWRVVPQHATTPGRWSAREATPRQRMACPVGARRGERGKALWATRPLVSRAPATFPPGHSAVSPGVMPAEQQRAMTKQARKTQHIERFTPTLRQRVSRLVRATRSFAKQLAHHIGALTSFLCHYHLTRKVALPV